ncbi:hypothetical protein ABIE53_000559 [Burkholderia sp. OAS925]|nr:hypothetical protein [Paraburkholderia graminis]MDR6474655.1 hypothetical protein [Paraburkholderia graminis]
MREAHGFGFVGPDIMRAQQTLATRFRYAFRECQERDPEPP